MPSSRTIAVSYFDNTSGLDQYAPLSKGLADMLITDLSNIESIQIVEREKLQNLLEEISIGGSAFFDSTTAQRLGKGLGAEMVLTGAFLSIDPQMRIDARLIEVETGKVISASQVTGKSSDFFSLVGDLVQLIEDEFEVDVENKKTNTVNFESIVDYSRSIELFDRGLDKEAEDLLNTTINKNPDFVYAKGYLDKLKARVKKLEKIRELKLEQQFMDAMSKLEVGSVSLGQDITNMWVNLMQKPNSTIAFNKKLKNIIKDSSFRIYGEMSPITFGEMVIYYDILAYQFLKNHAQVIALAEKFMNEHPTSMYYYGTKAWMDQSIKEIENRQKGIEKSKHEIKEAKAEYFMDLLDNPQYVLNKNDYDRAKGVYQKWIIDFSNEELAMFIPKYHNGNFQYTYGVPNFIYVANRFGDEEFIEILFKKHYEVLLGTDQEDSYYDLEESYQDYVDKHKSGSRVESDKIYQKIREVRGNGWYQIFRDIEQLKDYDLWEKALDIYASDSLAIKRDKKSHRKNLRQRKKDFKDSFESYKKYDFVFNDYQEIASIYQSNHQYADEISARYKYIESNMLSDEEVASQYFMILIAYVNLGYFEEASNIVKIATEKYSNTRSFDGIQNYKNLIYLD